MTSTRVRRDADVAGRRAPLLEARGLTRHFKVGGAIARKTLHAVDDVELHDRRARDRRAGRGERQRQEHDRAAARPGLQADGRRDLLPGTAAERGCARAATCWPTASDVPMVFQDPFASLNPAYRVVARHPARARAAPARHPAAGAASRGRADRRRSSASTPPGDVLDRYPYELSGGQRQRIGFAQALAYRPKLIVADEPVSMLDVSMRIGLLNLMAKLRDEQGVSLLYITHDIASARYVADRVMVMYAGHLVESGPVEEVLQAPKHPYTQLLLDAVPDPRAPLSVGAGHRPRRTARRSIDPTPGCRFRRRCPLADRRLRDRDAGAGRARPRSTGPPATSPPRTRVSASWPFAGRSGS